jgi:1,2-phenylacetyl-CoA epoxidase catalytic subunit
MSERGSPAFGLDDEERDHIASWALKTSRTEEWTGEQVLRLLSLPEQEPRRALVLAQASDELDHARLYGSFARVFRDESWCADYCSRRQNFSKSRFTGILQILDETPVPRGGPLLVRFYTGLFFLDLAGLMTVNVYQESPFEELHEIAERIQKDEGKHVQHGRELLLGVSSDEAGKRTLREAVDLMLPEIDAFFGGDDSPVQATLRKVGIRKTRNSTLKSEFRERIAALLHLR